MRRRVVADAAVLLAVLAALVALAPPAHAQGLTERDLGIDDDVLERDLDDGGGTLDLRDLDDERDLDDKRDLDDAGAPDALHHDQGGPPGARDRVGARALDGTRARAPGRGAPGAQLPAPPIGEVLAAAYAAAGLERGVERGLARRARLAGLVPWVSVRTGRSTSWRDDDPSVGRSSVIDVRATWRLDRLVFEPRELQAVALAATRQRERRRLARLVIEVYFRWARAEARARRQPRAAGRAAAAVAELDALTDEAFSVALARARRTASARRTLPGGAARP